MYEINKALEFMGNESFCYIVNKRVVLQTLYSLFLSNSFTANLFKYLSNNNIAFFSFTLYALLTIPLIYIPNVRVCNCKNKLLLGVKSFYILLMYQIRVCEKCQKEINGNLNQLKSKHIVIVTTKKKKKLKKK